MPDAKSTANGVGGSFWERYIAILDKKGIKRNVGRWYVRRAESFIKATAGHQLAELTGEDVTLYLENLGRKSRIESWQFRQAVDAIQILLHLAQAPCATSVNWEYWRTSAQELPEDHPTIARANSILPSTMAPGRTPLLEPLRDRYGNLLDSLVIAIRKQRYSIRTEQAYLSWVCRFLHFLKESSPDLAGGKEIAAFLQDLAIQGRVAASTQNQALNALVYFYRQVLQRDVGDLGDFARPKRPRRLPVVLSRSEISRLFAVLSETSVQHHLMASLLYGTGMRLMECIRLRVHDVDFELKQIMIRNGKGQKDRLVPLPESVRPALIEHLAGVRRLHDQDLSQGLGKVFLPDALAVKYPKASRKWGWQFVFPSGRVSTDPRSGEIRRHHIHENSLQKSIKKAAQTADLTKRVNCHALRHSFATHLLENGYDIRTIQELLGHADVSTTMIYTHVLNRGGRGVVSPLDTLL